VNSMQAINKASSVWNLLVSWDKMHSYYVLTYISWFCGGVWEVDGIHSGSTEQPWPSRVLHLSKPLKFTG
jgi:hypothetical protein